MVVEARRVSDDALVFRREYSVADVRRVTEGSTIKLVISDEFIANRRREKGK
jgi:hypothetical protein